MQNSSFILPDSDALLNDNTTHISFAPPPASKFKGSDVGLIVLFCMMTTILIAWSCYYLYQHIQNSQIARNIRSARSSRGFRSLPSQFKIVVMPEQTLQYAVREDGEPSHRSRPSLYEVSLDYFQNDVDLENEEIVAVQVAGSKSWHGGEKYFQILGEDVGETESFYDCNARLDSKSWHQGMNYCDRQNENAS